MGSDGDNVTKVSTVPSDTVESKPSLSTALCRPECIPDKRNFELN
jgi:hypothetical protein